MVKVISFVVPLVVLATMAANAGADGVAATLEGRSSYTYTSDALTGAQFTLRNTGSEAIWLPDTASWVVRNSAGDVFRPGGLTVPRDLEPGASATATWYFHEECSRYALDGPCHGPAPPGDYWIDWYYITSQGEERSATLEITIMVM